MNIKILNANTVKSTLGYKASAGCEIHAGKASAKSGIFEAFAVGPNVGAGAQADFNTLAPTYPLAPIGLFWAKEVGTYLKRKL